MLLCTTAAVGLQAESAERIAAVQADAAHDREELKGLVSMLLQKMTPPPQLAAEVSEDMGEGPMQ